MLDFRAVGWVALGAAMFVSTVVAARTWERVKTRPVPTIEVTGSAKRRIVSDLITWQAHLTAQGADRSAAYKSLHESTEKAIAWLKKAGLTPKEFRIEAATVQEVMGTEYTVVAGTPVPQQISKGFSASQVIAITSSQVENVERISREVTSLMEQGVQVSSESPAYFYTKLGELKIEMLAEASKDARVRAEKILGSAGHAGVGKLHDADMGVINVNPANSTSTSWDGNNDTSAMEKDIITIVHCSYEIGT